MNDTREQIDALRESIGKILSPFRFSHTLGVERTAVSLAMLYCPDRELMLRAAALLHDVTKENTLERQMEIFRLYGVTPTKEQLSVPPTLHALTAALIIPDEYPAFAERELIDAVRSHSTGHGAMTLYDKILYLSDYIEDTRKYDDCIALRKEFFEAEPEKMEECERMRHLNRVLLHAVELTVNELTSAGKAIEGGTLEARESLKKELGI